MIENYVVEGNMIGLKIQTKRLSNPCSFIWYHVHMTIDDYLNMKTGERIKNGEI